MNVAYLKVTCGLLFFFFFLGARLLMYFHGHSCPSIMIICIQPQTWSESGRGCVNGASLFFEQLGCAPPQTSSGEGRPVHLKLHHPERRSPTGLCPESPALLSLHTWLCVLSQLHIYYQICWWYCGSGPHFQQWWDRILGWGRETHIMVPGNCLSLNVSKTKELIVDFRKRHLLPYTPLMISGTPVERVSSFKYLGVNISEDLTWTTHIQTQVKKARQRLYHLRQLRKFRVSPTILKTCYSGTIESVLTQCISVWYGNSSSQDCKALQRVVRLAERISGSALPSLQDIYLKRCRSRAVKIIKTQITLVTVFSLCCHLVSTSAAWWQKLRDLGGVSSPRPSDSLTQTQPLNITMTSLINHSQSVRYSHSLFSTSYWQCHLHTSLSVFWYLIFLFIFLRLLLHVNHVQPICTFLSCTVMLILIF